MENNNSRTQWGQGCFCRGCCWEYRWAYWFGMKRRWAVCSLWDKTASTATSGSCQESGKTAWEKFQQPSLDWRRRLDQGPTRRGGMYLFAGSAKTSTTYWLKQQKSWNSEDWKYKTEVSAGSCSPDERGEGLSWQGGLFLAAPWLRKHHCSLHTSALCGCVSASKFPLFIRASVILYSGSIVFQDHLIFYRTNYICFWIRSGCTGDKGSNLRISGGYSSIHNVYGGDGLSNRTASDH